MLTYFLGGCAPKQLSYTANCENCRSVGIGVKESPKRYPTNTYLVFHDWNNDTATIYVDTAKIAVIPTNDDRSVLPNSFKIPNKYLNRDIKIHFKNHTIKLTIRIPKGYIYCDLYPYKDIWINFRNKEIIYK